MSASSNPLAAPSMGKFGGTVDPPGKRWDPFSDPAGAGVSPLGNQPLVDKEPAGQPALSAQQQAEDIVSKLTYTQAYGKDAGVLGQQLAGLIGSLSLKDAQSLLQRLPTNSPLYAAIQATLSPQQQQAHSPYSDPLALQTMWASVFGPAFDQASKMAGGSGTDYLASMKDLISGSNQSGAAKKQQLDQATAMSQLLGQFGKTTSQGVPAGLTLDSIIQALQQASGSAQLAQGAAEKAIAYGTAQAYTNPGAAAPGGTLGPVDAAAALNNALAGSQTSSPYANTGLLP